MNRRLGLVLPISRDPKASRADQPKVEEVKASTPTPTTFLGRVIDTGSKIILNAPKSAGEMVWRGFAICTLSSLLTIGWLVTKYPETIRDWMVQREETSIVALFQRRPYLQKEVMELLGSFVAEYGPTQIALVSWNDSTSIDRVWANQDTARWPTITDGLLSENMKEAVAEMIFEECWVGNLDHPVIPSDELSDHPWLICGIRSNSIVTGYVIAHWQGQDIPEGAQSRLDDVTNAFERLLY